MSEKNTMVTEHEQPAERLAPSLEDRLQAMIQAGQLFWNGKKLEPMPPVARLRGECSVADLLVEDRE